MNFRVMSGISFVTDSFREKKCKETTIEQQKVAGLEYFYSMHVIPSTLLNYPNMLTDILHSGGTDSKIIWKKLANVSNVNADANEQKIPSLHIISGRYSTRVIIPRCTVCCKPNCMVKMDLMLEQCSEVIDVDIN